MLLIFDFEIDIRMDLKCYYDKILVRPVTSEQLIKGLFIPDTSNNLKKGIVELVGPGSKNGDKMCAYVGQTVFYPKDTGTEITLEGVKYLLMRESDPWLGD